MFCLSCGCASECVKITEVQGKLVYLGGSGGSSIFTELGQESMGKWIINQVLAPAGAIDKWCMDRRRKLCAIYVNNA